MAEIPETLNDCGERQDGAKQCCDCKQNYRVVRGALLALAGERDYPAQQVCSLRQIKNLMD